MFLNIGFQLFDDFVKGSTKRTRWRFRSNQQRQRGSDIDRMVARSATVLKIAGVFLMIPMVFSLW
ncbi:MAG: hypothetical protein ACE10A_12410 [Acidiferrobacterales bacterium]